MGESPVICASEGLQWKTNLLLQVNFSSFVSHLSDNGIALFVFIQKFSDRFFLVRIDHENKPHAHIEDLVEFFGENATLGFKGIEEGSLFP